MKVLIVVLCYPFCVCSDVSSFISGTDHLYLFLSYQIGLTRGLLVSSVWKIWPLLSCFLFFLFFILQFYWSIINLQCCLHFSDVQQGYLHTHTHTHTHTHIILFQILFLFRLFSSVQSLSCVWLFATPWIAAHQASLSITNCWSLPKPMSIELVMPSNHPIFCPLLLLPSVFPSIRVFSNALALRIRWPKYWEFQL